MKNIIAIMAFASLVSCKKDKEVITGQKPTDSAMVSQDSLTIPEMSNPDLNGSFEVMPQNVSAEKGKAVFIANGKTQFYFDQNANKGLIIIDGKDYPLNKFDFTENNYEISGSGVMINASEGEFMDKTNDCVEGTFAEAKITLKNRVLNLANVTVMDCPTY